MGDLLNILNSINKVSLLAFFIVLLFLIYELRLISKGGKKKILTVLPNFDPNVKIPLPDQTPVIEGKSKEAAKFNINKIFAGIFFIMLIFSGGITILSFKTATKNKEAESQPRVVIQTVSSKGIKIFNSQWEEIPESQYKLIKPTDKIIIGLETISGTDIDRARIKVNDSSWEIDQITARFDKKYQVYYREYKIASDEYKLRIEGKLHSKVDGWLGD